MFKCQKRKCRLMTLHGYAVHLARAAPDILALPSVAKALEQELVHAMVWCLASDMPAGTRPHAAQRAKVIAKFEDFLAARQYEPVYLAEICKAIGVSERTLRLAAMSISAWAPCTIFVCRMHLARRALLGADPQATTVTTVATDHGFRARALLGRLSHAVRRIAFGVVAPATRTGA
jgi:transposase